MENLKFMLPALILLTQLDGKPVWVESTQVVIVRKSLDCAHGEATALLAGGKALCVREPVEEVREKIKRGNRE